MNLLLKVFKLICIYIGIVHTNTNKTTYYYHMVTLPPHQGPVALEYVWDWPETIPTRTIQRQSLFIGIIGLLWDFVNIS